MMSRVNSTIPAASALAWSEEFEGFHVDFNKHHHDIVEVSSHIIGIVLVVIGIASLFKRLFKSSSPAVTLSGIYLLSLVPEVSVGTLVGTTILMFVAVQLSRKLKQNVTSSLLLIAFAAVFENIIRLVKNGKALHWWSLSAVGQSDSADIMKTLLTRGYYALPVAVHVLNGFTSVPALSEWWNTPPPTPMQSLHAASWLLVPLIFFVFGSYSIDSKNGFCFFPGVPYYNRVVRCNIADHGDAGESRERDLNTVREWAIEQQPSETSSSHWWYRELPTTVKDAFSRCARSSQINNMFRGLFSEEHFCVDVIDGMNEIYITGPPRLDEAANSDQVFYTRHVDGPWGLIPFVSVFRCIVGMDRNMMITTHYPLANLSVNACKGDVIGFDFNREVHYITRDDSKKDDSDKFRVVLKLHYCMYPRVLAPLGWFMLKLNERYNMAFRALFLKTINPQSLYEKFLAFQVNFNTNLFDYIETYIGQRNLFYLLLASSLAYCMGSYEIFFMLTSFVHYFRYITTYYVRSGIDFGSFKRDVLLFKSLALAQLVWHYCTPLWQGDHSIDWTSVAMIVTGYAISVKATKALGIDRTYFGAELGLVEPKWVDEFPYGYIPHPMITSQVLALLGFHKDARFRASWPYVVPTHVFLYFVHMMQEHLDIHAGKGAIAGTADKDKGKVSVEKKTK